MDVCKFYKSIFFVLFIFFLSNVTASPSYRDITLKGKKYFSLLNRIYASYPFNEEQRKSLEMISKKWSSLQKEYEEQMGNKQRYVLKKMISTYSQIQLLTKKTSQLLEIYSRNILSDFSSRSQDLERAEFRKYIVSFSVSKREFERAKKAFRHHQFYYSTHLYDRGIFILRKIYKKLNWKIPTS